MFKLSTSERQKQQSQHQSAFDPAKQLTAQHKIWLMHQSKCVNLFTAVLKSSKINKNRWFSEPTLLKRDGATANLT